MPRGPPVTIRRGCEIVGALLIGGGAALTLYAVNDAVIRLAFTVHPQHLICGLALAFSGVMLAYLGRRQDAGQ
jgi:hypothetical protein